MFELLKSCSDEIAIGAIHDVAKALQLSSTFPTDEEKPIIERTLEEIRSVEGCEIEAIPEEKRDKYIVELAALQLQIVRRTIKVDKKLGRRILAEMRKTYAYPQDQNAVPPRSPTPRRRAASRAPGAGA